MMEKYNWLLIIAGIIFVSAITEVLIGDYFAVVIAMNCFWMTFMTWIILKYLGKKNGS